MKKVVKIILKIYIFAVVLVLMTSFCFNTFVGRGTQAEKKVNSLISSGFTISVSIIIVFCILNEIRARINWKKEHSNEKCCNCGKELKYKTKKTKLADGYICNGCLIQVGITLVNNNEYLDKATAIKYVNYAKMLKNRFSITQQYDKNFAIDVNNQIIMANNQYIDFAQIADYELFEDGESVIKGGITIGGIVGGVVMGSVSTRRKSKSTCNMMILRLTVRNYINDYIEILFITKEVYKSSTIYIAAKQRAQDCISALKLVTDTERKDQINNTRNKSSADEIMKYKQLLDCGAITIEEFNNKKAELLNF